MGTVLSARGLTTSYTTGIWPRRRRLSVLRRAEPGELVELVGEPAQQLHTVVVTQLPSSEPPTARHVSDRSLIMTPSKSRLAVAALTVGALTLAACGDDDTTAGTASSPRTVEIDMLDIEFSPDAVDVQEGETVRFVFHNEGAVTHDAFIGDEAAQEDHEMEMRGMGGGHDTMGDEGGITVMAGETGQVTHTFAQGEDLLIGCHQEGHYAAGMRIMVTMS